MEAANVIEIPGLREIEVMDLEEDLPEGSVEVRPPDGPPTSAEHGDFGLTTVIVILGIEAINGLSIWLAKRRVKETNVKDISLVRETDGRLILNYHESGERTFEESPDPDTVTAIRTRLSELVDLQAGLLGQEPT